MECKGVDKGKRASNGMVSVIVSLILFVIAHAIFISQAYRKVNTIFFVGYILVDLIFLILGSCQDKHPKCKLYKSLKIALPIESLLITISLMYSLKSAFFYFVIIQDLVFFIDVLLLCYREFSKELELKSTGAPRENDDKSVFKDNSHAKVLTFGSIAIAMLCLVLIAIVHFKPFGYFEGFPESLFIQVIAFPSFVSLAIAIYVRVKYPNFLFGKKWLRFFVVLLMLKVDFLFFIGVLLFCYRVFPNEMENEPKDAHDDDKSITDNSHAKVLTFGSIAIVMLCLVFLAIVHFKPFGYFEGYRESLFFHVIVFPCFVSLFIAIYVCVKYPNYLFGKKWLRFFVVLLMLIVESFLTNLYSISLIPFQSYADKFFDFILEFFTIIDECPG